MEIYEHVADPESFQAALDGELERLRFDDLLGGSHRHTEIFRPL